MIKGKGLVCFYEILYSDEDLKAKDEGEHLLPRLLDNAIPDTCAPVVNNSALGPLLTLATTRFLQRCNWNHPTKQDHIFALASGTPTFFLLFAPLQELDKTRPDNTAGVTLVSLA